MPSLPSPRWPHERSLPCLAAFHLEWPVLTLLLIRLGTTGLHCSVPLRFAEYPQWWQSALDIFPE